MDTIGSVVSFAHPERLWFLAMLLPLAVFMARGRRRREAEWGALAQLGRPRGDGGIGWLAAIACLILALGQPRWGRVKPPPLPPGHDVILLVDTSRSMAAEDAVPDRLGVAVATAESLLRELAAERGDRVGVVAFAGRGAVRCPLTANLGAVVEVLESLGPGDVRPGGTDLGAALDAAVGAFDDQETSEGRAIVVFSDGEDHAGTWRARLEALRARGIVVHSVAIGDPERGHPVPTKPDAAPLLYEGKPVQSRRSDTAFEALARATGGSVVPVGLAAADLGTLYRTRIAPLARRQRDVLQPPERAERYAWFVLAALVVGLGGSWPRGGRWRSRAWILVATLAALGAGRDGESAAQAVFQGHSAYTAGRFDEALAAFEHAAALRPNDPVVAYDAAATLFQLGRFAEARRRYAEARLRADAALRTKIDYALGNTALALGQIDAALRHYDDCLASQASGAALDAVRRDAAINRKFAEDVAKHAAPRADETGKDSPKKPRGDRGQTPQEQDDESNGNPGPTSPGEGKAGRSPQPRRGPGGAGGSGPAPPLPGSPDDQLDKALEQVREATRVRLPDSPPPAGGDVAKDW